MERHIKTLAVLHIVHGALILLTEYFALWAMGTLGLAVWHPQRLFRFAHVPHADIINVLVPIWYFLILAPLFIAIPGIIGGWGLYNRQNWGRIVILIVGVLCLVHFPIGTALGIYTLWVVFNPETVQLTAS